jgi:hypothetical protein
MDLLARGLAAYALVSDPAYSVTSTSHAPRARLWSVP